MSINVNNVKLSPAVVTNQVGVSSLAGSTKQTGAASYQESHRASVPAKESVSKNPFGNNPQITVDKDTMLKNSTQGVTRANPPASVKQALEPSFKIIDAYDPKAADWFRNKLKDHDFALAGKFIKHLGRETEIYAAWTAVIREGYKKIHVNDMVLGDHFWDQNDLDKASILYHEYTHAVDNPISRPFWKFYGLFDNLIHKNYGDKTEDKAYLAQWKMLNHFGRTSGEAYWDVKYYLEERNLLPKET